MMRLWSSAYIQNPFVYNKSPRVPRHKEIVSFSINLYDYSICTLGDLLNFMSLMSENISEETVSLNTL
jgi:hypothetical protein